jgi:hypothetical protein
MKYVNKQACLKRGAVDNICAEVEILRLLDHPFAATLWYTFQVGAPAVEQLGGVVRRSLQLESERASEAQVESGEASASSQFHDSRLIPLTLNQTLQRDARCGREAAK